MVDKPMPAPRGDAPQTAAGRSRRRRYALRALAVVVAVVAAALATTLTVDLGPSLRARAEQAASRFLQRPMHIGRLSALLRPGHFVLEDVVIEGLTPEDRPFLRASRIAVTVPWWSIFTGDLVVESVRMSDWAMVIEVFPGGRRSLPRLTPERRQEGPRDFTTTVRLVRAERGEFTFEDHGTPWSTVARNLTVTVTRMPGEYRGRAIFSGGTVRFASYEPMGAAMNASFVIEPGGKLLFDSIALDTDGARSMLVGEADLGNWPEMRYEVRSRVEFARMREIFFAGEDFSLSGEGQFTGTFHLYKGGRELKGTFASEEAGVNEYRFPRLRGSLVWLPDRFEVTEATARPFGGAADFAYSMAPLGGPRRAIARFDVRYEQVDLAAYTDFLETEGFRLAGRASGRNLLEWPLGRFAEHRGGGLLEVDPPSGVPLLGRRIPPVLAQAELARGPEPGPFNPRRPLGYVPVGGHVRYEYGPEAVRIEPSWVATPKTYVQFEGETAYGERSRIPFHVTSADWQESDRLLAAILTTFGSPTGAVELGGEGEFDGIMLQSFAHPRIEGRFAGDRLRAWDVVWGRGGGRVVVEDGYVDVSDAEVTFGDSKITVNGRFSLGYPRRDGKEEIDARVQVERRPLVDLRHAFGLDDYDVAGVLSGEFHLNGQYREPLGFGRMTIEDGLAYGERFEGSTAGLRFEGNGVRLDGIQMMKGAGTITGAAFVGWNGSYSFNADGRRIPVERIDAARVPLAPLSGVLQFSASGTGSFASPRYEVRGRIADLFAGDEGVGQVTGRILVRGEVLMLELEAASPRLTVSGSGRIALTSEADAELTFRYADTSLDPYLRLLEPRLSPFATAVVGGTIRVAGELGNVEHLLVDSRIESLDLKLFDYRLRNDGPLELALDQNVVRVGQLRLVGDGTELDLAGQVDLGIQRIDLRATGDANLGILQGFFRDIRSSGGAEVVAQITGPIAEPVISGTAFVANGRIRHFALPHGVEAIDGRLSFDAAGIHMDDVVAKLGGGDVRFGGRIGLAGYRPSEFNLTTIGERMRLRYPEGFRSEIDADLALRGEVGTPVLSGTVTVRSAVFARRFEGSAELLGLSSSDQGAPDLTEPTLPLRYDLRIVAPGTLRIENNMASIVSSADLTLGGTYDRPVLFGRAEIDRGEVLLEGNRYRVTRGTIDFANQTRIEPFFDVEAETRVRVPGQTYQVTFHVSGTADRFVPEITSDPPLPTIDIVSLLFGEVYNPQDAELRALRSRDSSEQALLSGAARLLASPIASPVGRAVEETFGVDTVQITPLVGDVTARSLNPAARLTIGKRLSNRLFVTFSRALSSSHRDQIILLEYDQSDRIAWIVSQNEDRTYALDFRVRYVF